MTNCPNFSAWYSVIDTGKLILIKRHSDGATVETKFLSRQGAEAWMKDNGHNVEHMFR